MKANGYKGDAAEVVRLFDFFGQSKGLSIFVGGSDKANLGPHDSWHCGVIVWFGEGLLRPRI